MHFQELLQKIMQNKDKKFYLQKKPIFHKKHNSIPNNYTQTWFTWFATFC